MLQVESFAVLHTYSQISQAIVYYLLYLRLFYIVYTLTLTLSAIFACLCKCVLLFIIAMDSDICGYRARVFFLSVFLFLFTSTHCNDSCLKRWKREGIVIALEPRKIQIEFSSVDLEWWWKNCFCFWCCRFGCCAHFFPISISIRVAFSSSIQSLPRYVIIILVENGLMRLKYTLSHTHTNWAKQN